MGRLTLWLCLCLSGIVSAQTVHTGRVTDSDGNPVAYATVYLQQRPTEGTATNNDGRFTLTCLDTDTGQIIISCIGYEKQFLPLDSSLSVIVLREQPIALEETVVEAKRTRKSKRKLLAQILRSVYLKLDEEAPHEPVAFRVVSDVKLDAQAAPWGMEQMIATVYEQADIAEEGTDSVQFVGEYCKRFCPANVRQQIDSLYVREKDKETLRMAGAIDSGTVVHSALWKMRLDKQHLLDLSDELRRWRMTSEDNTRCVLTYTRKHNFLGILKSVETENLIVDAFDFTLQSYTVQMSISLFLPFSIRLRGTELDWLNLFNIGNEVLAKFRLKRGEMHLRVSTLYRRENGVVIPYEKNLVADGYVEDKKKNRIPVAVKATQQVISVQTEDVHLLPDYKKSAHVERVIVPIY